VLAIFFAISLELPVDESSTKNILSATPEESTLSNDS
jgi:hypothetical protein